MASFADINLDPGLARGLKRGDRRAQGVAYRVLAPTVMGLAQRILQDEGAAQEVVQDTFVELIEHARTLNDAQAVVGWVRKVAVNHCLMRLRSPWSKRRESFDAFDVEGNPDGGLSERFADTANGSARVEGMQDIETALGRLEPETRMVIWLHDVEGYTHQEIGTLVGRTASYSKSQMARGYQKLSTAFGGTEDNVARAKAAADL
ncbi:MAG: RNA polymerase sigma factor [Gammaproteobacteria bacterium]|nr:RNA polymerase sigma factor [Gammaproteobacteria bacterium]